MGGRAAVSGWFTCRGCGEERYTNGGDYTSPCACHPEAEGDEAVTDEPIPPALSAEEWERTGLYSRQRIRPRTQ